MQKPAATPLPEDDDFIATAALIKDALRTAACENVGEFEAKVLAIATRLDHPRARLVAMMDGLRVLYLAAHPTIGLRVGRAARPLAAIVNDDAMTAELLNLTGICAADSGSLLPAMQLYADALPLAVSTGAKNLELKIWLNIGNAYFYAGLVRESVGCYRRLIDIAETSERESPHSFGGLVALSNMNIALSCLHLNEIQAGINAIEIALETLPAGTDALSIHNRVLAENYFTRLLIEKGDLQTARLHAREAREHATKVSSARSDLQASVAEGLTEVFSGEVDVGLGRLTRALQSSREHLVASREVLVALIKALEHADRHDDALKYLRELLELQRKTGEAKVLNNLRAHLADLHMNESDGPMATHEHAVRAVEIQIEAVEDRAELVERQRKRQRVFDSRVETLEEQAVVAELRDDATGAHCYRVGRLACLLAKELHCDEQTVRMIDVAARLHDIGKVGIPDGILMKPGSFNQSERLIMESHSEIGAGILAKSGIPDIETAVAIARHHHERWDGKGYPEKIGRLEIPLAARITSLADVFDALTHKRPYKAAWTFDAAIAEIIASRGYRFDPELTDAFVALITRLNKEHHSLDEYLGQASHDSSFVRAQRLRIINSLHFTLFVL